MTDQHVPVERLAAYAAGDLDATHALDVEAHVLLCAQCRSDAEAVNRATAALSSLPSLTMPDDVATRVDAALAAEGEPAGPAGDVLPMVPKRRRPTFAGIAAVAAGIALLGAISVPWLTRDDRGPSPTAADGARREAAGTRRLESGLNYTHGDLGDTLLRALSGVRDDEALASAYRAQSDSSFTGGEAPAATPSDVTPQAVTKSGAGIFALRTDAARQAACVLALAEGLPEVARTPLLIDFALFDKAPAMVVVFPTVRAGEIRSDRIDVFVVGARCGITPGDDDVFDFARFARPSGL